MASTTTEGRYLHAGERRTEQEPEVRTIREQAVAVLECVGLALTLGTLLLAEYAILWHLLFAPWLDSLPPLDARYGR